eukprot:TRINITY_DN2142_c0_g1_i1.p1 TRINITY_DN2142_c0_g1~~TRINITY_DN2142_c0_g1_i1.p1  ORF type:complete len:61 (-),score=1.44 TRINITY_DN2142_c0_g1_i1:94-276(-)
MIVVNLTLGKTAIPPIIIFLSKISQILDFMVNRSYYFNLMSCIMMYYFVTLKAHTEIRRT